MNQKERLESIRQKHEKEQEQRKILLHRIIAAVVALLVIIVVIFSIKGCVKSVTEKEEQKRQEQKRQEQLAMQATPEPTQVVIENPNEISQDYYANSAFTGNSFVDGLVLYNMIDGADYFSKIGLSVNDATKKTTDTGTVPVIEEFNSDKKYSKIFMMFGENELGWRDPKIFVSQYGELIEKLKQYQSESKIYLLAITPITKKVSDEDINCTTNERILEYNELIKQLAADKGVVFADIHSAVVEADGVLAEGAASDGVHFGQEYYKKCLLYIQNNLQ